MELMIELVDQGHFLFLLGVALIGGAVGVVALDASEHTPLIDILTALTCLAVGIVLITLG